MSEDRLGPEVHAPLLWKIAGQTSFGRHDQLGADRLLYEAPATQTILTNAPVVSGGRLGPMSVGEELLEQRRRRRRAGDPRLSPEGREILRRLVSGDLTSEFQTALDAVSEADPLLGGGEADPDN